MKKRLIIITLLLAIAGFIGYGYIYQDHRNIETEQAEFNLDANALATSFSKNSQEAETKYLNKTIEVTGKITELVTNEITINDAVFCTFDSTKFNNILKLNDTVTIKGRCIGFDDLLEIVKLDQCTLTTKN